jgi:predicted ATPase
MPYLTRIDIRPDLPSSAFPFSLPLVRHFRPLSLQSAVTFFTGENGTGKSTFLEAIAASANLPTAGGADIDADETLQGPRLLGDQLRLGWKKRTRRGFFLRAEDFFRFQQRVNLGQKELGDLADSYSAEMESNPANAEGVVRARGYILGQRRQLEERYGANADARSHGEAFLHFFEQRLVPGGLYLLDEPEAPLSPLRQLAFLSLLKRFTARLPVPHHHPFADFNGLSRRLVARLQRSSHCAHLLRRCRARGPYQIVSQQPRGLLAQTLNGALYYKEENGII